jgi:hypothetical protein
MADHSRRRFLTTVAGAGAAGLAGCNGLPGGSGDGGGDSSGFRADVEFVPASVAEGSGTMEIVYVDIPTVRSDFPDEAQSELGMEEFSTQLGIDVDDLGGLLGVETEAGAGAQVLTGSFDTSDVLDELGIDEGTSEYEGYEVVMGEFAITDGALVIGSNYEGMIDAKEGSADRLVDSSDQWSDAVDNAASGAVCGVETAPDDEWTLLAMAINAGSGGEMEFTGYAHFESASDAEANREAVRDDAADDMNEEEDVTIESVSVDGSVVVVEAVAENFSF